MPRRLIKACGPLVLIGALFLALVTCGCAKKLTAQDIVARMQEVMSATNDAHSIVEVTAKVQGLPVYAVAEIWQKRPDKVRVELPQTKPARFTDTVIVTNGQTAWLYIPNENQVLVVETSVMPAYAQAMSQGVNGLIQQVLDASDIELLGQEEVSGTGAYKLSLAPSEDQERSLPLSDTATLWVDEEQWIVLKADFDFSGLEGTMHVRSFELNPGLDEGLFSFEVPQGAEVVNTQDEQEQHLTLDEAEAQADFDLLTPEYLPAGPTLVDVIQVEGAFVLVYDVAGATVTVAQSPGQLPPGPLGAEETVTVRGSQATLITDQITGASSLAWQENGISFAVAGRISAHEAIKIAESLK